MRQSEIFRRAAELVDSTRKPRFFFQAIETAAGFGRDTSSFEETYFPVAGQLSEHNIPDEPVGVRVLALLFLAAISEAEGE